MASRLCLTVCCLIVLSYVGRCTALRAENTTSDKTDPESEAEDKSEKKYEESKARFDFIYLKYCNDATKGEVLNKTQQCVKDPDMEKELVACSEDAYGTAKTPEERKDVDCSRKKRRVKRRLEKKCVRAIEKKKKPTPEQQDIVDKVWDAMSGDQKTQIYKEEDRLHDLEVAKVQAKDDLVMDCTEKALGIVRVTTPAPPATFFPPPPSTTPPK